MTESYSGDGELSTVQWHILTADQKQGIDDAWKIQFGTRYAVEDAAFCSEPDEDIQLRQHLTALAVYRVKDTGRVLNPFKNLFFTLSSAVVQAENTLRVEGQDVETTLPVSAIIFSRPRYVSHKDYKKVFPAVIEEVNGLLKSVGKPEYPRYPR